MTDITKDNQKASVATSLITKEQLESLLGSNTKTEDTQENYYFLKWPDRVSGFVSKLPDKFPSPEGQMFNYQQEIRWKKQGEEFNILCLTIGELDRDITWEPLAGNWSFQDREAAVYPETETRFPNKIINQVAEDGNIVGQRYFLDSKTATVHFVALTVGKAK